MKKPHATNKATNRPKTAGMEKSTVFRIEQPAELLVFLLERFANKSRNAVKSMLARGQVSVNKRETTQYNYALRQGDEVVVQWDKLQDEDKPLGLQILYEDDDLIVIHKEAGLLSIAGGDEKIWTAHRQLMEYVRRSHPQNRIFIVHRLDRDTSGVMVFAKNSEVQQTLQNAWKETVLERTYIALVERKVKKPEDTIVSWLTESRTLMMYSSPTPNGGLQAITHYKVLQATSDFSMLEIRLETGRKNQIRVHMQQIGHPVVGDKKYGSTINPLGRLGLHAQVLSFVHPTNGQTVRFESPTPPAFARLLKR